MAASAKESDENVTEWDVTNDAYQLGDDQWRCGINRCILGVIGVQIKFQRFELEPTATATATHARADPE